MQLMCWLVACTITCSLGYLHSFHSSFPLSFLTSTKCSASLQKFLHTHISVKKSETPHSAPRDRHQRLSPPSTPCPASLKISRTVTAPSCLEPTNTLFDPPLFYVMRAGAMLRCVARVVTPGAATGTSPTSSSPTPMSYSPVSVHSTRHALRTRDITLRVPSSDKLLRFSFCSTRHLLAETIRRHDLLRSTRAHLDFLQLLGTQLTFTNLLASALEGEERVEARFTAEEAAILTEALALGECRCHLGPEYNAQLEARGLPTFPLRVNRVLYRQEKPFSSVVHADLAELLQPSSDTASNIAAAATRASEANNIPLSLHLPNMTGRAPLEAWKSFFSYNSSLHAYNYLRRSDGSVSAVWMQSRIDAATLLAQGFLNADNTAAVSEWHNDEVCSDRDEEKKAQDVQRALRHAIPLSFGVMVTPLAAGGAVEHQVNQLNRVVMEAAALLCVPSDGETAVASPLQLLVDRCAERHTTCQHILSLVSGDYEGAYQVAVAARQYSDDPAQVAAVVDPIRRALGVQDFVTPLAATEAARTGIDFFCRCSKQHIIDSLASAPLSTLESLRESGHTVHCCFCGRQHKLAGVEWQVLKKTARSAITSSQ
ncbi:putative Hsp33 protein [Leishmania utingensis]|uniref:Hsp33 protein n=1 Tax=Leishmania utingensis TaxID=653362 RepID=A0AAW3A6L5_9TRYP